MEMVDGRRMVLEERYVENPLTTDGLVRAAIEEGEEQPRWTPAYVNLVTMIGGLARVKGLTDVQRAAATWWRDRSDQERSGLGSIDYELERVDGSAPQRDGVVDTIDAIGELRRARRKLGPQLAKLLNDVICDDMGLRELARSRGAPNGGSGTMRYKRRVFEGLDALVAHLASRRRAVRSLGARALDWSIDGAEADAARLTDSEQ